MKNHKWKYDPNIGETVCINCGIAIMKNKWTGEVIYVDFTKDSYFQCRIKTERPECIKIDK